MHKTNPLDLAKFFWTVLTLRYDLLFGTGMDDGKYFKIIFSAFTPLGITSIKNYEFYFLQGIQMKRSPQSTDIPR